MNNENEPAKLDSQTTGSLFGPDTKGLNVKHRKRVWVVNLYPYLLLLIDVLLIVTTFVIAICYRYEMSVVESLSRRVLVVILFSSIVGLALIGGYSYRTNKSSFRFISEHIIVSIGVFVGVFFLIYSFVSYGVELKSARSVIAFTLVAFPVTSIVYRYVLSRMKLLLQRGNAVCIIGVGEKSQDLSERLSKIKSTLKIILVDSDESNVGSQFILNSGESVKVEALSAVCFNSSMGGKYVEDYVVTCPLSELPQPFLKKLARAQFSGNSVTTYETYLTEKLTLIPASEISMDWVMNQGFKLNKNPNYDRFKRLVDIVFSALCLLFLLPVFILTALAVKMTSSGPIFFKQKRIGHREEKFTLYKFRSMKEGSEKGDKYTAKNDTRLTLIGKVLRKTRLDELPQFWNVLCGDLSVIGPRAEWDELVAGYEQRFPYYHFRHAVKPGITGWAQVNYSYGQNDEDTMEKLQYDLYYIRKYSPMLDMIIVVKTFYMIIFGRGQ